jgi:hypothetical protein
MAFRTFTFSSRSDSLSTLAGGSIARLLKSWKRWLWTTSRIAAVSVIEAAAALDTESSAIVICTLSTWVRIPERSRSGFEKRKNNMLWNGRFPSSESIRKDVGLDERAEQDPIQVARRGEVLPEGLLDDDAAPCRAPDGASCSTTGPNSGGGIAR